MSVPIIQIFSIVLPNTGTGTLDITDLVTHASMDIPIEYLRDKTIHLMVTEIITVGVPGNLQCWIELSPVPSTTSTAYWAAIGGGGGALAPTAPLLLVATGVTTTVHTALLPWVIHSAYARVVMQTPVSATPLTAFWRVQALIAGKGA